MASKGEGYQGRFVSYRLPFARACPTTWRIILWSSSRGMSAKAWGAPRRVWKKMRQRTASSMNFEISQASGRFAGDSRGIAVKAY